MAALIVVAWHFQFFFNEKPYIYIFMPFYNNGQVSVDIFFVISGFILMHVYNDRISDLVDFREFMYRRLARLYPLHIITLCVTAIIFYGFFITNGKYGFFYTANDMYHFFLNVVLLQFVGLQENWSFNAPAWTISSEFWVNILFGLLLIAPRKIMLSASLILGAGSTITLVVFHGHWLSTDRIDGWLEPILLRTTAGFFAGVITYIIWERRPGNAIHMIVAAAGAICMMSIPRTDANLVFYEATIAMICAPVLVYGAASTASFENLSDSVVGRWLGEISYSVYMWHFPVAALFNLFGLSRLPAFILMPIYLGVVLAVATASVRFVEFPARRWLVELALRDRSPVTS